MKLRHSILSLAVISGACCVLRGADDTGNDAPNDAQNDSVITHGAPLVKWTFDDNIVGTWLGAPKVEDKGPQPPVFPNFKKGNKAAYFSGKNTALVVKESDKPGVNLRFDKGDTITIEAWVNIDELKNGNYAYIVGKGRNGNKVFQSENQNYALRLKGENGEGKLTFLFRSQSEKPESSKDYHRWISQDGFSKSTGWHHVAITYTFGKPDSIKGWIDGKTTKGAWDMAGKTERGPVNDADDLMIGTGNGGGPNNTLNGWLDNVAIYREKLPDNILSSRFQFVPPAPVVDVKSLPAGKVLVQICEQGVPEKNAWPSFPVNVTESYTEDVFGLFEVPQKYIETGIRADRPVPYILRAAAKVTLPAGKHRLLLRGRGASHLHVDGKQLLSTPFPSLSGSAHGRVAEQEGYLNLGPDFRFAPPGNGESWCEFETKGGEHVFVMEQMVGTVVGKSKRRPEIGETVVAISLQGSESWELVTPGERKVAYTDAGWAPYEKERRDHLAQMNTERRNKVRAENSAYWTKRASMAQEWLASQAPVKVPALPEGYQANNAIDHFISAKIAVIEKENNAAQTGTVNFFRDIQPILETKCFDCHQGTKVKGGLKLDTLVDALKGGKSDGAAVTPGKPHESSLLARVITTDEDEIMPPKGDPLTKDQIALVTKWIEEGAHWPEMRVDHITITPLTDDLSFLRRVTLDTVGVVPTLSEIEAFTNDTSTDKRAKVIDRLLADSRWADNWTGYWQDVLAENPNILNPTLNNTGPFRWWIYESLLDDKPMDLFVTELVRMKGSQRFGGPAGFSVASQNDVPMAAKGTIVSTAFLGVEMKCARCHDAPAHKSLQEDLFALGAMLGDKALSVPVTSSVPMDKLHEGGRKPLIQVTLKPGATIQPKWPFPEFCDEAIGAKIAEFPEDERDELAALITAPQNERFAQVMTNRVWARLMGRGIVEPVADWEKAKASDPALLHWLAQEFVRGGYSMKNLARLILNSQTYQRATDPTLRQTSPLFTSPAPRRLAAEQIVDSLFAATGTPFKLEEVNLDIDSRRDSGSSLSLGQPTRSWMLTSTSNERDRPSLALPRIQAVTDVLTAFGWRGSRQDPLTDREKAPNALQPAILSNGTMAIWLTRLSEEHGITHLALKDQTLDQFVNTLFMQLLTRKPTADELAQYKEHLQAGYDSRIIPASEIPAPKVDPARRPAKYVSWSNHLDGEATLVRQQEEISARQGDAPTARLNAVWRQKLEDALWAITNSPEWIFTP